MLGWMDDSRRVDGSDVNAHCFEMMFRQGQNFQLNPECAPFHKKTLQPITIGVQHVHNTRMFIIVVCYFIVINLAIHLLENWEVSLSKRLV